MLSDPIFWIMLMGVLAPSVIVTTIFFHQAYLLELKGWNREAFAAAFMLTASMTVIHALIGGALIGRFGAVRMLPYYLLSLGAACLAMSFAERQNSIFLFMGLLGISYELSSTLFGALWPGIYGTLHLGGNRSITMVAMVFSSALGPGLSSVLIDFDISYLAQIFVMGMYCLAARFVMLFVSCKLIVRVQSES